MKVAIMLNDMKYFLKEDVRVGFCVDLFARWCFLREAAVPPAAQCHTFGQHKRLLFIHALYTSHSRQAKKKYAAIKNWSILSSCPLHNVFKKARPSAWFLFRPLVEISYGRKQRCNTVTGLLLFSPPHPSTSFHNTPQSGLTVSIIIKPF